MIFAYSVVDQNQSNKINVANGRNVRRYLRRGLSLQKGLTTNTPNKLVFFASIRTVHLKYYIGL
jgi:hypothetical protein